MKDPVITLLTDFGCRDSYAGVMKGVLLSICPRARIVDLTHAVPAQNVRAASFILSNAWQYFPEGSVHVCVVDPGVGSDRKMLAARAGGHLFLAPDNGLLSEVFRARVPDKVVSIENAEYYLAKPSLTFHGRDVFAPAAAHLANGTDLGCLGTALEEWQVLPAVLPQQQADGSLAGEVIYVDHFGNLVTNIPAEAVTGSADVEVCGRHIQGVSRSYCEKAPGELLAIVGSTARLEISVNSGSAATDLGAGERTLVQVWPSARPV